MHTYLDVKQQHLMCGVPWFTTGFVLFARNYYVLVESLKGDAGECIRTYN